MLLSFNIKKDQKKRNEKCEKVKDFVENLFFTLLSFPSHTEKKDPFNVRLTMLRNEG